MIAGGGETSAWGEWERVREQSGSFDEGGLGVTVKSTCCPRVEKQRCTLQSSSGPPSHTAPVGSQPSAWCIEWELNPGKSWRWLRGTANSAQGSTMKCWAACSGNKAEKKRGGAQRDILEKRCREEGSVVLSAGTRGGAVLLNGGEADAGQAAHSTAGKRLTFACAASCPAGGLRWPEVFVAEPAV